MRVDRGHVSQDISEHLSKHLQVPPPRRLVPTACLQALTFTPTEGLPQRQTPQGSGFTVLTALPEDHLLLKCAWLLLRVQLPREGQKAGLEVSLA